LHLLTEKVHAAWRQGKVATALLLDVSGAFDNVSHTRLVHNLRKRRLPLQIVHWIADYLRGRTTTLRLAEGNSARYPIDTGIPQGSPLSPILYLFYNADLVEIEDSELTVGYIDDVALIATGKTTEETNRKLTTLHERAEAWAKRHASVFAPAKYEVIYFMKRKTKRFKQETGRELTLPMRDGTTHIVTPSPTVRYLGVWLDNKLTGEGHIEKIEASVSKSVAALAAITGSTWGITMEQMRQIYRAVIVPKLLYAASVWMPPGRTAGWKVRYEKYVQRISRIQKRALCQCTGAFKTTACATLEIEAGIEPIEVAAKRLMRSTAVRIASTPMYQKILEIRGNVTDTETTISPLQRLERDVQTAVASFDRLEETRPAIAEPWWIPPKANIANDKQRAQKEHRRIATSRESGRLLFYTDGSAIDGHVGAAVTLPAHKWHAQRYMGPASESNVYVAELYGIYMACQKTQELALRRWIYGQPKIRQTIIFADSQGAILSTQNPTTQSGQWILRKIVQCVHNLRQAHIGVNIYWIPGHKDIRGNEEADLLAKEATGWRPPDRNGNRRRGSAAVAIQRPILRSAYRREIKAAAQAHWERLWDTGNTGRWYHNRFTARREKKLTETIKDTRRLYGNKAMRKAVSTIVCQMRTSKIGLNSYLFRIKARDTASCRRCNDAVETVQHVLYECEGLDDIRSEIFEVKRLSVIHQPLEDLLTTPKTAIQAAKFLKQSQLLPQFEGVYIPSEALEEEE
jgi:ribonuclease HI